MPKATRPILFSPSLIAGDLTSMGPLVKQFDPAAVDLLHLDVMDGHFVPNLTFGPEYIRNLMVHTPIPLDIHLMIEKPELSLDRYCELKPWCVTIHYESTRFPARLLSLIREKGIRSGISLNPATPVESVFDLLPYCDLVLVMSVDPGFYGQPFMKQALGRIQKLKGAIEKGGFGDIAIQVDGGIGQENVQSVVDAGASIIVAGSSAFKGGDINKNLRDMKASLVQ